MSNPNVETVKNAYAEFQRGDVAAILERFADEFEFTTPGAPVIPYAGTKRNAAELVGFFQGLSETVDLSVFEPQSYLADGNRVIALGRYAGEVRQNGHRFEGDWAMAWTFREDGKVVAFREYSDPTEVKAGFGG